MVADSEGGRMVADGTEKGGHGPIYPHFPVDCKYRIPAAISSTWIYSAAGGAVRIVSAIFRPEWLLTTSSTWASGRDDLPEHGRILVRRPRPRQRVPPHPIQLLGSDEQELLAANIANAMPAVPNVNKFPHHAQVVIGLPRPRKCISPQLIEHLPACTQELAGTRV